MDGDLELRCFCRHSSSRSHRTSSRLSLATFNKACVNQAFNFCKRKFASAFAKYYYKREKGLKTRLKNCTADDSLEFEKFSPALYPNCVAKISNWLPPSRELFQKVEKIVRCQKGMKFKSTHISPICAAKRRKKCNVEDKKKGSSIRPNAKMFIVGPSYIYSIRGLPKIIHKNVNISPF